MRKEEAKKVIEKIHRRIQEDRYKERMGEYSPYNVKGIQKLIKRLNSKPRFILEIIQNADDNKYSKSSNTPQITFVLKENHYDIFENNYEYVLEISYNEDGFEKDNVEKLCQFFGTTKGKIGFKGEYGTGFKSIFSITHEPYIYSNGFSFKFLDNGSPLDLIDPIWIEDIPVDIQNVEGTMLILPITKEKKDEIVGLIRTLSTSPELLLFLKKIEIIEIIDEISNLSVKLFRNKEELDIQNKTPNLSAEISVVEDSINKKDIGKWLVIRESLRLPPEYREEFEREMMRDIAEDETTDIVLAFPLKKDNSPNPTPQNLFSLLPVSNYGLKFILQADFILTPNRESIIEDKAWNKWLLDKAVDVFVDALPIFREMKFMFYGYLSSASETDDALKEYVDKFYDKLRESECIFTESESWKKPKDVYFVSNKKIKEIITNEDLKQLQKREYKNEKIKLKKEIRKRLQIDEFDNAVLLNLLEENNDLFKEKTDMWFFKLYSYLSEIELDKDAFETLKKIEIIRLESGETVAVSGKDAIFLYLQQSGKTYGFEKYLRVLDGDIYSEIQKEKDDKKTATINFLEKLGIKEPKPTEIIENHILSLYDNNQWKELDSSVLRGHILYLKDAKLPNEKLKKYSQIIYVKLKNGNYAKPDEVYLSKEYKPKYPLHKLFEGITTYFLSDIYLKKDRKPQETNNNNYNNNNNELKEISNKKSKSMRKTSGEEDKSKKERKEIIKEWRKFFIALGVNEFPKIIKNIDSCNDYYGHWGRERFHSKYRIPKKTNWKSVSRCVEGCWPYTTTGHYHTVIDWKPSDEIEKVIESKDYDKLCILFKILNDNWKNHFSKYIELTYKWFNYYQYVEKFTSSFGYFLKEKLLVPTTKGLKKPSEAYDNNKDIRNILGDDIPFLDLNCKGKKIKPDKDFLKYIGINFVPDAHAIVGYIRELVSSSTTDKKKFEKMYELLSNNFDDELASVFMQEPLIYIPRSAQKYYSIEEVIWENKKDTFGSYWGYLSEHYPDLKKFFVEQVGVPVEPTLKHYVDTLRKIEEKYESEDMVEVDNGDKDIIIKMYEKISDIILKEDYEESLFENLRVLTTTNSFVKGEDAYVCDVTYLRGDIDYNSNNFLWMPNNYNFKRIEPFLKAINVNFLSKDMKMHVNELSNCSKVLRNSDIDEIVEYIRRYIYHTNIDTYEEYKKDDVFCKLINLYIYECPSELKIKLSHPQLGINIIKLTNAFWDYRKNILIKTKNTPLEDVGEALCKGLPIEVNGLLPTILYITREWKNRQHALSKVGIAHLPLGEKRVCCEKEEDLLQTDLGKGEFFEEEESGESILETTLPEEAIGEAHVASVDDETISTIKEIESKISFENHKSSQKPSKEQKKSALPRADTKNKKIPHVSQISTTTKEKHEYIQELEKPNERESVEKENFTENTTNEEEIDYIDENEVEDILSVDPTEALLTLITLPAEENSEQKKDDDGNKGLKMENTTPNSEYSGKRRKIGSWAEEVIYCYLKNHCKEEFGVDGTVEWMNKNGEQHNPYDIVIRTLVGKEIYIEVKGTNKKYTGTEDVILLSEKEYAFMKSHGANYVIYRVFNVGNKNVHYIKITNPSELEEEGKIKTSSKTKITYVLHLNTQKFVHK